MRNKSKNAKIEVGTGNVFAQLDLPNPEERLRKARLINVISDVIKRRQFSRPILAALGCCWAAAAPPAAIAQTATPTPVVGGAFQRSSVEGCAKEFLFNGVWRIKVLSVDTSAPGAVAIKLQVRNGSKTDHSLAQSTGFGGPQGDLIDLVFSDDNTATMDKADAFVPYNNAIAFKHVPVGGGVIGPLTFAAPKDAGHKPVKLLIGYNTKLHVEHAHYSVKDPSFRVRLDCSK